MTEQPRKIYIREPKQRKAWDEILENPAITRYLFHGGARSGKTDIVLLWHVKEAAMYPGCRILLARKHLDHARNTIWKLSLRKLIYGVAGFTMREGDMEVVHDNGSVIRVTGLDDQERVDKILGDEYSHIFINEATQITYDTLQTVLTRLSLNVPGLPVRKCGLDCNPKSQRHWLYKVGVQHVHPEKNEALPDAARWADLHWTPFDNSHLSADYLDTLKSLTGAKRRRMLEGVWCDNEGAVYDEFDEDIHVFEPFEIPKEWKRCRAIDFGYTNPFVCLWGAVDKDGRLYIYRERYLARVLTKTHAEAIKAAESANFAFTVADHDAEERAELSACGISTKAAKKEVIPGIENMKKRLAVQKDGKPRLFISRDCVNLLSEFYDYVWEPPKENRNAKEEPRKEKDHAVDAARYLCQELDTSQPFQIKSASIFEIR